MPVPRGYLLAFSGGLDSTVLLHLLARMRERLQAPLRAVHVHHGLHPDADSWSRHCMAVCEGLSVPLEVVEVQVADAPRQSLEMAAREARYDAIASVMDDQEMVLLAHHGDDQVETLLLQLLRGAGAEGLASMPSVRRWRRGWLARPLLGERQSSLREWASRQRLEWLEDPSNADRRMARNYLRHEVLPLLRRRWPGLATTLGRSARHCAEAAGLCADLAALDLLRAEGWNDWQLRLPVLAALSPPRRRNLVRHWMRCNGVGPPSARVLDNGLEVLLKARPDSAPEVHWKGGGLRRFRDRIYLFPAPLPPVPRGRVLRWSGERALRLPEGLGELRLKGERPPWFPRQGVEISFRRAGLKCGLAGRAGRLGFKRLAQELGIPPWLRPRLPLVVIGERLAAVADKAVCEPFDGDDTPFEWMRGGWLQY